MTVAGPSGAPKKKMEEHVRVIARSCHTTLVLASVYGGSFPLFLAPTVLHFFTSQLIGAD
jgi:hypothetical protein